MAKIPNKQIALIKKAETEATFELLKQIGIFGNPANKGDIIVSKNGAIWTLNKDIIKRIGLTQDQIDIINNTSGINTGDQTSIVGILGTKAQFNTSLTDGDFLFVGDIFQYTDEMAQDAVGSILNDSIDIDFTYNDAGNLISAILTTTGVSASTYGSASQVPQFVVDNKGRITSVSNVSISIVATQVSDLTESVQDIVATLIQNGTGLTWTYVDGSNTLTGNVSLSPFSTTNLAEGINLYYTQARFDNAFSAKSTSNLTEGSNLYYTDERVDDRVSSLLLAGSGISLSYNDIANTLTITCSISQYTDEQAQDAIGAMIDATLTYVDGTPLLSRSALTGAITSAQGSNVTALGSFTTAQLNTALSDNDVATGGGTATGTNTGDQTITLTGDVTGSGTGSFATTIANAVVTLAKMANVATGTIFYRKTAGTGSPEVQTLATLKTDLSLIGTNSGDDATNTTSNTYADAKVTDAINNGVTTIAPSQNAVFDALALKQDATIGEIKAYGGSSAPANHFLCDGSAVNRTTYANLFAVIGTTFGVGDGSTTFNVPDLRQRFPLGKATAGTGSTLGGTGGTIDHLHTVDPPTTTTGAPSATVAATILLGGAASTTHTHTVDIPAFNSGTANAPFLSVNYIIRY